jgi:predicted Zn-dependent protease
VSHKSAPAPLLSHVHAVYIGMAKLLLVILLALVGCAAPPATFTAQPGLEEATRAAVAAWEQALPCDIHVEYVSADAEVTVEWLPLEDTTEGVHRLGEGGIHGDEFLAWGTFESWVYVDPETTAEQLFTVVAHEMGHALRAPHTTNERDLMFHKYTPGMSSKPTARDGRSVCEVWGY